MKRSETPSLQSCVKTPNFSWGNFHFDLGATTLSLAAASSSLARPSRCEGRARGTGKNPVATRRPNLTIHQLKLVVFSRVLRNSLGTRL
jgi:hypothetical protein